jgi:hypothetical protein
VKAWIVGSVVALLGSSAGVTWGDSITLKLDANQPNPGLQNSIQLSYRLNSSGGYSTYSYAVGALSWREVRPDNTLGGDEYTFCIQIWQDVYENASYTFNQVALDSASTPLPNGGSDAGRLTADKAKLVQGLVNAHYGSITFGSRGADLASDINAAAMQLAIWEIIYDGGTSPSFTSGDIQASGLNSNVNGSAAVATALTWLQTLQPSQAVSSWALESDSYQDQMIGIPQVGRSPVPLPPALPAGGLLLGGIAILRKIRHKTR